MLNNNHHKKTCEFSEVLVAFLYGEATGKEKIKAEEHLSKCSSCAVEFADFRLLRTSIHEWRQVEFAHLDSPVIEISELNKANKTELVQIPAVSKSWFDGFGDFLTRTKNWAIPSVAFAALTIFVGLAFFWLNISPDNNELAGGSNTKPVMSPISDNSEASSKEFASNKKDDSIEPISQPTLKEFENSAVSVKADVKSPVSQRNNGDVKTKTSERSPNQTNKKNDSQKKEDVIKTVVPRLTNFDEETDKSLRLADLFDEIDAKE